MSVRPVGVTGIKPTQEIPMLALLGGAVLAPFALAIWLASLPFLLLHTLTATILSGLTQRDVGNGPLAKQSRDAMRARRISGAVYVRQEDVVRYLRETARDWADESHSEVTLVAADCVDQIADQLARITA